MGLLEEMIARADSVLENGGPLEAQNLLIGDYIIGYQKQTRDFSYASVDLSKLDPSMIDLGSVRSIRTLLVALKEKRDHELAVAGASSPKVSAVAQASASIEVSFDNTMSQMWGLSDDVLDGAQKQELAKLLQGIEDAKGSESKLKKAGKAVADWLFDNAVKAVPTVMPYVVQTIQGILG